MDKQQKELTLNALKFSFKNEHITVYLTKNSEKGELKFSERDVKELTELYDIPDTPKDLYANLTNENDEQLSVTRPVSPELCEKDEKCWSISFLKKYLTYQVTNHFKALNIPCRNNFIADTEVWIEAETNCKNCKGYRVYTLRVQFNYQEKSFEMLVIPGAIHSVYNKPVTDAVFSETGNDTFGWVMYKNEVLKYNYLTDDIRRNLKEVFPCLNKNLKKVLYIPDTIKDRGNRYLKFMKNIQDFRDKYIVEDFLNEIIVIELNWKKVIPAYFDTEKLKVLQFGTGTDTQPKYGMPQFGPVELIKEDVVFFFIGANCDSPFAITINEYFEGKYPTRFKGISEYLHLKYQTEKNFSIWFKNIQNPLPEIKKALQQKSDNHDFKVGTRYVAIYLSPHSKYSTSAALKKIYFELKELLLNYGIVSQTLEVQKFWPDKSKTDKEIKVDQETGEEIRFLKAKLSDNFHFSLPNIAVAIFAKLGGRPWSFEKQEKEELVIGVSAYFSHDLGKKYLGSAFSFTNEGKFGGFECFSNMHLSEFGGSIKLAINKFRKSNPAIERLNIHFYKKLNQFELRTIQRTLSQLNQNIPVIVVTVNKTFSEDVVGFDITSDTLMPVSGNYLILSDFQFLLYNNQLTDNNIPLPKEGFPFPLKLNIEKYEPGNNKALPLASEEITPVMEQICRFSTIYWKSVSRQWMPVTLLYPEMLAEIASHFKYKDWGELGDDSLWFL